MRYNFNELAFRTFMIGFEPAEPLIVDLEQTRPAIDLSALTRSLRHRGQMVFWQGCDPPFCFKG